MQSFYLMGRIWMNGHLKKMPISQQDGQLVMARSPLRKVRVVYKPGSRLWIIKCTWSGKFRRI